MPKGVVGKIKKTEETKPWNDPTLLGKYIEEKKRRGVAPMEKPVEGRITSIADEPFKKAEKFAKRNTLLDKFTSRLRRILPGQDAEEK